jgi:hypothetical protein
MKLSYEPLLSGYITDNSRACAAIAMLRTVATGITVLISLILLRRMERSSSTSSSRINQVERFFALLAEQQIKRGAHRSTVELKSAIKEYIKTRNADPKPFRRTKQPTTFSLRLNAFVVSRSAFTGKQYCSGYFGFVIKSKLRTGILVDVHPVSPRNTEASQPQLPWLEPDGQPVKVTSRANWPRRSFARGYDTLVPWIKMRETNHESRDHKLRHLRCPPTGLQV